MRWLSLLSIPLVVTGLPQKQYPFGVHPTTTSDAARPAISALSLSQALTPLIVASMSAKLETVDEDSHRRLQQHIEALPEKRLVRFGEGSPTVELTEGAKALLTLQGIRFIDVTNEDPALLSALKEPTYPTKLSHTSKQLEPLFKHINIPTMKAFLTRFSGFYTRYYRSSTDRESQQFLLGHLKEILANSGSKANVTFSEFEHSWTQRTIIVRFEPTKAKNPSSAPIVILGAHQDSTNSLPFLRAPGADDDGSGTTTLVTAFRALAEEHFEATTVAVEFMFFSAEEGGLLGSGEVAQAYAREEKQIRAMFHMDVVAFVKVSRFYRLSASRMEMLTLISILYIYAEIDYVDTACGYGCSDFASFHKIGAPAACLSEGQFEDSNPHMHSAQDTIDIPEFSFEHMAQFVRVGIAYAIELGKMKKG
ncbi:BZ3500_MvSof-1268-A1-R1_Chr4-2g07043 [Microbotryum saponariae]|uniref:Peptide hydrolase n=1 Tax=Microbotryum saponariae TaxID=289078 RepID=A0A2X0LN71_9BASI|nr:BZ3500_MvSof-1268-A1-R1_Chr4-2g07043 [Microbotryum saponariae]SDA06708.1 BZ3501_MvSof-1269-A2-R1_Chr4-2g06754 [Microbotryum saponariae]